jgi:hypothetical protein
VELAQMVRQKGLLYLDNEIPDEQNYFLKTALQLAVDSTHPEMIKEILQTIILADAHQGSGLLSRMIIMQGVICIVNGENPLQIAHLRLLGMLGEKYMKKIDEYMKDIEAAQKRCNQFMQSIKDRKAMPECEEFESFVLSLDRPVIQQVFLRDIESQMLYAFYGCSYNLLSNKLSDCMSMNTFASLTKHWENMVAPATAQILEAQQKIIEKVKEFEKR